MRSTLFKSFTFFGAAVLATNFAFGATWTWTGGGATNNWFNGGNWNPTTVPANNGTADVSFGGTTRLTPDLNQPYNVNAVNFLDGLDGLASSVTALGALGSVAVLSGWSLTLAIELVGALAGFLVWNAPPAKVHLGDSGSYLIGTALALLFLAAAPREAPVVSAAFLFVGVPVADTAVAIVRRMRAHRPLMQGDRGHVYDQLVDRGWSVNRAVFACAVRVRRCRSPDWPASWQWRLADNTASPSRATARFGLGAGTASVSILTTTWK